MFEPKPLLNADLKPQRPTYDSISGQQQMYEIFKSLIEHPDRGHLPSKNPTYYQKGEHFTYKDSGQTHPISENHIRKTSFTPEQEKYLDLVRMSLLEGIISKDNGLVERFKNSWQPGSEITSFEEILANSFLDCLKDTFDQHPKLIPAYYAFLVSIGAGADGLALAVREGLHPRRITSDNLGENYGSFVGVRGKNISLGEEGSVEAEVQCAAPVIAMNIIKKVQECIVLAGFSIDQDKITTLAGQTGGMQFDIREMVKQRMGNLGYNLPD